MEAERQNKQEEQKQVESPENLQAHVHDFVRKHACAASRKARCETTMRRKIAKRWAPEKKLKMVRRLMTANNEIKQAEEALQSLHDRIAALKQA